jgi:hypothetical protein
MSYLSDIMFILTPGMHIRVSTETIWPGSKAVAIDYDGVFESIIQEHIRTTFTSCNCGPMVSHVHGTGSRTLVIYLMWSCYGMQSQRAALMTRCTITHEHKSSSTQLWVCSHLSCRTWLVLYLSFRCDNLPERWQSGGDSGCERLRCGAVFDVASHPVTNHDKASFSSGGIRPPYGDG